MAYKVFQFMRNEVYPTLLLSQYETVSMIARFAWKVANPYGIIQSLNYRTNWNERRL